MVEYTVDTLVHLYDQNMKRFYIYITDSVSELFAEDYGKTWRIAE